MTHRVLMLLWTLGAVMALIASLIIYDGKPNSDADLVLGYAMLALSFPLGFVISVAANLLGQIAYATAGYVFTTNYVSIIVTWFIFFIAGYVQWFVLLPWLWRKWKAKCDSN